MISRPAEWSARREPPNAAGGFTLLEVMVALAILASSLIVLLEVVTNNARATQHARMVTTATFLARGKMVEIEDGIIENGFGDIDVEESGTFEDQELPQYRWDYLLERVDLPANIAGEAQEAAGEVAQSDDPMQALAGFVGGMMGGFIEPVRVGLQESVRRVTLRVSWDEVGRPDQSIEVVTFMTDPSRLDLALPQIPGGQVTGTGSTGAGTPSTGGTGGTGGSGGRR